MKKLEAAKQIVTISKGREKEVIYSILVTETGDIHPVMSHEHYGIAVEDGETARYVPAITPSADKIQWLCTFLSQNTVTPIAIDDVVADLLGTAL